MRRDESSRRSKAATRCRRWGAVRSRTCADWRRRRKPQPASGQLRQAGAHPGEPGQSEVRGSIMQRRQFLSACAAIAGASGVGTINGEWTSATPRLYSRSRLMDHLGEPIKAAALATRTNYVFQYPYAGTPCFLLNLGRRLAAADKLLRADGARYAWSGGVGRQQSIVAYSAICAHKLAYPTREVSFIRYQPERSPTSDGVIHCCADHSVYDPSAG